MSRTRDGLEIAQQVKDIQANDVERAVTLLGGYEAASAFARKCLNYRWNDVMGQKGSKPEVSKTLYTDIMDAATHNKYADRAWLDVAFAISIGLIAPESREIRKPLYMRLREQGLWPS